ncbi:rCG52134 [Rattus norvegicus]|uniref:RCG52134 n=1 Tax=Rattus norvegicus TaxID=10116 RepID=A6K6B6_RAT|nr:rCG52134 [Rattus norvegicus]
MHHELSCYSRHPGSEARLSPTVGSKHP